MINCTFVCPQLEVVDKIEVVTSPSELEIELVYLNEIKKSITEKFLYDRDKKRYYRMERCTKQKEKSIKRRIGEDVFRQVFGIYLRRRKLNYGN